MRRRSVRIRNRASESSVTDDDAEIIFTPAKAPPLKTKTQRSKKKVLSESTICSQELDKINEENNECVTVLTDNELSAEIDEIEDESSPSIYSNRNLQINKNNDKLITLTSSDVSAEICNVSHITASENTETKIDSETKVTFYKYISDEDKSNIGLLSNAIYTLKDSIPFVKQLKKSVFFQLDNNKNTAVKIGKSADAVDICELDSVNVSDVIDETLKERHKQIQVSKNMWFREDTNESSLHKNASAFVKENSIKEVQKLMKKCVLPDDLERMERAPKLLESLASKKKEMKKKREETAGKGWFNLPKTEMTEEIKKDIQIIQMRNALDTKRHYKRADSNKLPKYFQIGTIVEGSHEFHSARISKKDRKRTLVDELLADADFRRKNKKRFIELQKRNMGGGKGHYKKMKNKRKETWERT